MKTLTKPSRLCVTLPDMESWHKATYDDGGRMPVDNQLVMGIVKQGEHRFRAAVVFQGNELLCEFIMGGKSVCVTQWLPIYIETPTA